MKVENVFVTLVLLLISSKRTFQQFAGCRESFFLHKGTCTPCPDRCETCISDTNCTKCYTNYYGPVCQYTCPQDCDDPCHKEHGYCTYGCADGRFPDPTSPRCLKCPAQCRTCKSMTECFECIPGYYDTTCEKRCSSYCERCNTTTGACLVCTKGYFNQERQCRRCPDGCESCPDENNCSSCQSGYYTLKGGQCILECPLAPNTSDLDATAYLIGDMMSHGCTDTARGQRFVIKTKKPCIQYSRCSPNSVCTPEYEGKSACGTIQTYQCSHSCRKLNESYCRCEPNCTITEESLFSMALCFTNEQAFTDIKLSMESECSNVSEGSPNTTPQPLAALIVALISVTVAFVVCVSLVLIRLMKGHHTLKKSRRGEMENSTLAAEDGFEMDAIVKTHMEIRKPYDETVSTRHLQDDLEIDQTPCLNGNNIKDATLDTLKTEETSMPIREDPNQKLSNVDCYPYTRGSQSMGSYQPTNNFPDPVTLLARYTPIPQIS